METENFKHLYNVLNNEIKRIEPMYDRQADYQTNSKSYYDYLAKLKKLFELLSNRIWEYDEELKKRFEEWDKLIEKFPENVEKLLVEWLEEYDKEIERLNEKIDNILIEYDDSILGTLKEFRPWDKTVIEKIKNEFYERAYNPKWFNLQLNENIDDSEKFQEMIDILPENSTILFPQNSKIMLKKPIYIKKNNIKLDFNNSTLIYKGTEDISESNGKYRTNGAINFLGNVIENTRKTIKNIKKFTNIVDKEVYETDEFNGYKEYLNQSTRITLEDDSSNIYKKGDIVSIVCNNYFTDEWDKTFNDNPSCINLISKVLYVDNQYIYLNFSSDFYFDEILKNGYLEKINTINNIEVNNVNYIDSNENEIPENVENTDRNSWVGFIRFTYCNNVTINNIKGEKFRFPCISLYKVYDYKINNSKFKNPRTIKAGCGYGVQIMNSNYGNIDNVTGNSLRHLLDFSGSGNAYVKNCKMNSDRQGAFDCHGQGEFNITFNNCIGRIQLGNGINSFPEMCDNIKIYNHIGHIFSDWCKSLYVNNSIIFFDAKTVLKGCKFIFNNTKMIFKDSDLNFYDSPRNKTYLESTFEMYQCSIDYYEDINNQGISINDRLFEIDYFDNVNINISKVNNTSLKTKNIYLCLCKEVNIINSFIDNLSFIFSDKITSNSYQNYYKNRYHKNIKFLNNFFNNNKEDINHFIKLLNKNIDGNYNLIFNNNSIQSSNNIKWLVYNLLDKNKLNINFLSNIIINSVEKKENENENEIVINLNENYNINNSSTFN